MGPDTQKEVERVRPGSLVVERGRALPLSHAGRRAQPTWGLRGGTRRGVPSHGDSRLTRHTACGVRREDLRRKLARRLAPHALGVVLRLTTGPSPHASREGAGLGPSRPCRPGRTAGPDGDAQARPGRAHRAAGRPLLAHASGGPGPGQVGARAQAGGPDSAGRSAGDAPGPSGPRAAGRPPRCPAESSRGSVTARSRFLHSVATAPSRSGHGPVTAPSRPGHGPVTAWSRPGHATQGVIGIRAGGPERCNERSESAGHCLLTA
jgi:hypothetical protein